MDDALRRRLDAVVALLTVIAAVALTALFISFGAGAVVVVGVILFVGVVAGIFVSAGLD
ncbi:hypothetical protein [Halorubrum sp. GN11_10-6_MGM]|uniref:hypothetical protein n=1 Tax=Halorubrum sp. GN11_10-6_MGM TaxID=2518112 RepID=UPI00130E686D|nr:hypothetical protein [Halorubrum sp. GN11_10-6_MGM]